MKKYKKGELEKTLLVGLMLGSVALGFGPIPAAGLAYMLFEPQNAEERYRIKLLLRRLRGKKMITVSKNGRGKVALTKKGLQRAKKYQIGDISLPVLKKWDKVWRVIVFDIPEEKKRARQALSRKLKELGCYQLQKSVYVFAYPCFDEIAFIAECFHVQKYIHCMEARVIQKDRKLRQFFQL